MEVLDTLGDINEHIRVVDELDALGLALAHAQVLQLPCKGFGVLYLAIHLRYLPALNGLQDIRVQGLHFQVEFVVLVGGLALEGPGWFFDILPVHHNGL